MRKYHHIGFPTDTPRPGETYLEGYKVFCEEPEEALPVIVRALDGIGCQAGRLETRAPSLEDVFFKVTRKPLRS